MSKSDGCWHWRGWINPKGYGRFHTPEGSMLVHRLVFELLGRGRVPSHLTVEHDCHTRDPSCTDVAACLHRRCVNPDHLRLITNAENVLLGHTSITATNARKTECVRGHAFDEENTYVDPRGNRVCRQCHAMHQRAVRARKKTALTKHGAPE